MIARRQKPWASTFFPAVVAAGIVSLAGTASADTRACAEAHASGQRESRAGHLRNATQLFTRCGSDETCPEELRRECTEYLQTVRDRVPTVIFAVQDAGGQDVSDVQVYLDDEPLARRWTVAPSRSTPGSTG